jgi:hypothetical protein
MRVQTGCRLLIALSLLLPETARAAQFYPINVALTGGSLCAKRPAQRLLIVDGTNISFRNPYRTCSGGLEKDGHFAFSCGNAGNAPFFKLAGQITGMKIAGRFDVINERRRDGTEIQCTGTFAGARRVPPPAAKPAPAPPAK